MKKTVITALLSVILTLAGTVVAYKLLSAGAVGKRYADFNYNAYAQGTVQASQARTQYAPGGCRGSGPGGCGGCGRQGAAPGPGGETQGNNLKAIEELAAKYYIDTYGDKDFEVKVQDYGCHQEAYILKGGKAIKKLSISGGSVYEVG